MLTNYKPASDWYKKAFRSDYLRVYPHRNDKEARVQVEFLLEKLGGISLCNVLDIGCGDGRHSLEFSRRGYKVTGLDLSDELLERAYNRAKEEGLDTTFIHRDMREVPKSYNFDLVVNFFTSFGYFQEDRENAKVLNTIAQSLCPGGSFLMDYLNREYVISNLVPEDHYIMDTMEVNQKRWITGDWEIKGTNVRINKEVKIRENGSERIYNESVRMYTLEELEKMMSKVGLEVTQTYGDFDGQIISKDAPRTILIGKSKLTNGSSCL